MNCLTAFFTAITVFFSSFFGLFGGTSIYDYQINTGKLGDEIPNVVSNINDWAMGTTYYNVKNNEKYDVFNFVKYVQLMQCTGGTPERDLFVDPYDTSTLTDYDFSPLIENCRGIISLGAKPHLKLGGVPIKFTTDYIIGGDFSMNPYPPDDYNVYYEYIKAIAQALVDEFGLNEVKTWRFGCMTEFENQGWFFAKDGTAKSSEIAYCKLYDYTVQALIDVIGEDVFVGAHCMGVTEGLWDERNFIKHCGIGTNYATGEKGTHINFISASYYDGCPGEYTSGLTLPQLAKHLKKAAEKYGLDDLLYGIDEGRLLYGINSGSTDNQLNSRKTGYTWQAAYDARLFKQAIDSGMDYFSSWSFLTGGNLEGYPTISYHVADNISRFAGGRQAKVMNTHIRTGVKIESDCLASWDEGTGTLRLMSYNFKNSLSYKKNMTVNFNIRVPQLDGKTVTVTQYLINDECNFFDEWTEDRKTYGIGDDCFCWSPDDPCIENITTLSDSNAREFYFNELRDKYEQCSQLVPETQTAVVKNGKLSLSVNLGAGNVIFYEIHE